MSQTDKDLSFMTRGDVDGASGIDPAYEELMKRAEEVEEAEESVGRPMLPRSDFHVGKVIGIAYRNIPFDPPIDGAEITIQAVDGSVPDAVGRFYRDTLRLEVGNMTRDNKDAPLRERTPTEQRQTEDRFIAQMKRVQRVLGTASLFPSSKDPEGISLWGETAVSLAQLGQLVVFTGYQDNNGFSRIIFSSIRNPEDPAKDHRKKGRPVIAGKTALDQAYEVNAKAAEKEGKTITLPGTVTGPTTTDF